MLCTVVHDGQHFVAHVPEKRPYRNYKRRVKKPHELAFRELYRGTKMGSRIESAEGITYKPGLSGKEQKQFIIETLDDTFGAIENWHDFVDREFEREKNNYHARVKRFRRKAFLNTWNYFVTFTYDSKKGTEDSFKARLRRCLSNLHTRRNWLYMGVFERAPDTGRLHFHGLFNVPDGQGVGSIRDEQYYDKKAHKMRTSHINDWFEKRFGRNDFAPISNDDIRRGPTLNYVLKYLEKTGERIVYSRGIPSELQEQIEADQCCCEFYNFIRKWVLFDDYKRITASENHILEGDEAEEWLICFADYDHENIGTFFY